MWDEDGNQYIDYIGSWGPMILGHNQPDVLEAVVDACARGLSFGAATKIEVDMARLICDSIPSIDLSVSAFLTLKWCAWSIPVRRQS